MLASFFGRLFGTDAAMKKTLDAGIAAADAIVFTEQERAEMQKQMIHIVGEYMQKTTSQDLARRVIALALVSQYLLLLNIGTALALWGTGEQAEYIFNILQDTMQNPLNIIIGFYFLTQTISNYTKNAKKS